MYSSFSLLRPIGRRALLKNRSFYFSKSTKKHFRPGVALRVLRRRPESLRYGCGTRSDRTALAECRMRRSTSAKPKGGSHQRRDKAWLCLRAGTARQHQGYQRGSRCNNPRSASRVTLKLFRKDIPSNPETPGMRFGKSWTATGTSRAMADPARISLTCVMVT